MSVLILILIAGFAFIAGLGAGRTAGRRTDRAEALNKYERHELEVSRRALSEVARMARQNLDVEPQLANLVLDEVGRKEL